MDQSQWHECAYAPTADANARRPGRNPKLSMGTMKARRRGTGVRNAFGGSSESGLAALPDLLMAAGVASILLVAMAYLSVYSARSFSSLSNYEDMATRSRQTIDLVGWSFRQASAVVDIQTNPPVKWLTVTSNVSGSTAKLTFDSQARTLILTANARDRVLLKGCDAFDVKLYN